MIFGRNFRDFLRVQEHKYEKQKLFFLIVDIFHANTKKVSYVEK